MGVSTSLGRVSGDNAEGRGGALVAACHARCFSSIPLWFVEEGVGDARLVKHGITGKAVFEVRQENTLQPLCNFFLVPDRELRQCKELGMVGLWSLLGKSTREHPPRPRKAGASSCEARREGMDGGGG